MKSVFLSYCHKDKDFVRNLAVDLILAGCKTWIDEGELKIGDSLNERIENSIHEVDYLIACLSAHSAESFWVKKEIGLAMKREMDWEHVVVLPVLLPNTPVDLFQDMLGDKLFANFRDKSKHEEEIKKLLLKINPRDIPYSSFTALTQDDVVNASRWPKMGKKIVKYYETSLDNYDPNSRYWIYMALGKIGGKESKKILSKGLHDRDDFARQGAKEAYQICDT
jgi:hypothetical protein